MFMSSLYIFNESTMSLSLGKQRSFWFFGFLVVSKQGHRSLKGREKLQTVSSETDFFHLSTWLLIYLWFLQKLLWSSDDGNYELRRQCLGRGECFLRSLLKGTWSNLPESDGRVIEMYLKYNLCLLMFPLWSGWSLETKSMTNNGFRSHDRRERESTWTDFLWFPTILRSYSLLS